MRSTRVWRAASPPSASVLFSLLLRSDNSLFSFLSGVKSSGTPLERRVIVAQCAKDTALLRFVCDMVREPL